MNLNRNDIIDENAFDDSIRSLSDAQLLDIKFSKIMYPEEVFRRVQLEMERRGLKPMAPGNSRSDWQIDRRLFVHTNAWWLLLFVLLGIWQGPLICYVLGTSLLIALWPSYFKWRHFQRLTILLTLAAVGIAFLLAQNPENPYF
ncbi:MAG: hypothetical protein AAF990_11275 [Bacteroidota bacterium]